MTQADWVKELIKIFNEDKTLCALDYDCPVCDKKYKRIFKIVEKQITLAQQRTEKKWRDKCEKLIKEQKPGWGGGSVKAAISDLLK